MNKVIKLVIVILIMVVVYKGIDLWKWYQGDVRLAIVGQNGVKLVAISPLRGMTNLLEVSGQTMMWMGPSYSWYRADRLAMIKKEIGGDNKVKELFWMNFGFWPDLICEVDDISNWDDWSNLQKCLGIIEAMAVRYKMTGLFVNQTDHQDGLDGVGEIISSEFADNYIAEEGLRVSVFNNSDIDGLANFMANRLSWSGFNVVEVGGWYGSNKDGCQVIWSAENRQLMAKELIKLLFDNWPNCTYKIDEAMENDVVEIVLDEDWAKVINYNSYVRTF